jgi:crotonobetainyl-CoA:carnitine CoA-transferase CaiB-like acyl-CoA transferase
MPVIVNPIHFDGAPAAPARPGPLLGADTDDVLRSVLGMDAAEIERARTDRVLV